MVDRWWCSLLSHWASCFSRSKVHICIFSGVRAKNALCATVESCLLLSAKVLKPKTWVVKLEEEEVKTRRRRRNRCLAANSQSSSRSLTGLCLEERRSLQMMLTLESSSRMEAEMTIVSEESRELADTLEEREVELLLKVRTISGTKKQNFLRTKCK